MAHLHRAAGDGVQRLEWRHQFAAAEYADGQAALRGAGDELGQQLRRGAQSGEVLWPGSNHPPFQAALGDRRRGKARRDTSGGAGGGGALQKRRRCMYSGLPVVPTGWRTEETQRG